MEVDDKKRHRNDKKKIKNDNTKKKWKYLFNNPSLYLESNRLINVSYIFYDYQCFESHTVIFFRFVYFSKIVKISKNNAKSSIFHKPDPISSLILPTQHKSMKYLLEQVCRVFQNL